MCLFEWMRTPIDAGRLSNITNHNSAFPTSLPGYNPNTTELDGKDERLLLHKDFIAILNVKRVLKIQDALLCNSSISILGHKS